MLRNDDLQVGIHADLGIVDVVEATAFLGHDSRLGISKADLLGFFNGLTWINLYFALLKGFFSGFDVNQPALFVL